MCVLHLSTVDDAVEAVADKLLVAGIVDNGDDDDEDEDEDEGALESLEPSAMATLRSRREKRRLKNATGIFPLQHCERSNRTFVCCVHTMTGIVSGHQTLNSGILYAPLPQDGLNTVCYSPF